MKIVIDIPQGLKIDFENENWTVLTCAEMKNALEKAVLLPKGHGRLKDVDWIEDNCEYHHSDKDGSWCYAWKDIDNAPTIIEADNVGNKDADSN